MGIIKKIQIYKGPIWKVYADNFRLIKKTVLYDKKFIELPETGYFYIGDGKGGDYINIKYNCVLPDKNKAINDCASAVKEMEDRIYEILIDDKLEPKERNLRLKEFSEKSRCLYYDRNSLETDRKVDTKELKKMKLLAANSKANEKKK